MQPVEVRCHRRGDEARIISRCIHRRAGIRSAAAAAHRDATYRAALSCIRYEHVATRLPDLEMSGRYVKGSRATRFSEDVMMDARDARRCAILEIDAGARNADALN